jgi:hypothetical protein
MDSDGQSLSCNTLLAALAICVLCEQRRQHTASNESQV